MTFFIIDNDKIIKYNKNERSFIYCDWKVNMHSLQMGIDIGSTTAKVAVLDQDKQLLFSAYRRHNAETLQTLQAMLEEATEQTW